jgi:hypothetical protein
MVLLGDSKLWHYFIGHKLDTIVKVKGLFGSKLATHRLLLDTGSLQLLLLAVLSEKPCDEQTTSYLF